MSWVSVDDSLPPIGEDVLCFRPDAVLDWSDKPLKLCRLQTNGKFTGMHEVTHWMRILTPPGWKPKHSTRQNEET